MNRSILTRSLAIALVLVAGVVAAQPPVRSFSNQSFAVRPRVIKAEHLGESVPPGIEQVGIPSNYWSVTDNADVTFVRQSLGGTTTLREVNRLPQRAEIQQAVMRDIEPNRMRVTVSLGDKQLWIKQGKQTVSVPLEIHGGVAPTQADVQTLGKVGKALAREQARTWKLPDSIVLDMSNNQFFYRMGDYVYPLKLEKIQGTFEVVYPASAITRKPYWMLHVATR